MTAILFDLDGTLIDQESASASAVQASGAELGLPLDGIAQRWTASSTRHYARYQSRAITFSDQRRERVRDLVDRALSDAEADELFAGYLRLYEAGWALFPDTVPCLEQLRAAGVAVGVLTNGDRAQQLQKLDRFDLAGYFDAIVCSSDLPHGKPHPIAYASAVRALGRKATDVIMVGDNLEHDVQGALAAGLPAVLRDRAGEHRGGGVATISGLDGLVAATAELTP